MATPDGLWLESTADEDAGKPARFRVRAVAIGREGGASFYLTDQGQVRATRETALFLRAGLIEDYTVSMDGVRQDFVLPQRPAGTGVLRVELVVDGARVEAANYGAKLTLDGIGRVIAYSRLHVADAKGRELSARLEVTGPGCIRIQVDDSHASYPLRIDPTFSDADWVSLNPGIPGVNSYVSALAVDGAGNLYAASDFTIAGTVEANRIAKWDGSEWSALGSGMNDWVSALAVDGAGNLYAGGNYTTAGGVPANRIAKWNGYAWAALGSGMNDYVNALVVDSAGNLYAGGDFTIAGTVDVNRIAKWDGNTWSALGEGISGEDVYVQSLAVSGTDLYAGGYFTTAGRVAANRIAKWDGSGWSPLGEGISGGDYPGVYALAVSGTDLYAGGDFTTAGRVAANHIAKWDGSAWSPLGEGMSGSPERGAYVSSLAVSRRDLYVAGRFTTAGGVPANQIAKWDGSAWSALGSGITSINASVSALAVSGTDLYAGGDFTKAGAVTANYIAKWNGSVWSALGSGMNERVYALAVRETVLYAGGEFTTAGEMPANHIAKWDGSKWSALGSGMYGNYYYVSALAVDVAGNLYAGGNFSKAGGVTVNSIAKWNGNAWSTLGSGIAGYTNYVSALVVDVAGNVIAGGRFTTVGGVTANNIARWDGSVWSPLGTGMNDYANVSALAVDGVGNLYAGGSFTMAGGMPANHIAKWDGNAWSALGTGMKGDHDAVYALTADAAGHLFVGGKFITAGTTVSPFIAQANVATTLETWRQTWYGTTHNTGNAADLADPHHSGISNLMVYAFLGPDQNPELASISRMPAAQSSGGNYFIRFTRPAGVSGVTYGAQWSPNLAAGSWQPLADTGSGTQHLFSLQMAGKPRAFIRLSVTNPLITLTPLETWRQTWYGTTSNTGNAADLADPYHTGIPNLLVFAFMGPNQNPAHASMSQMPAAQSSGGNCFIRFNQPAGVNGVTYGAQWSPNLAAGSWLPLADTGIAPEHLFSLPMAGQPRAFIRLTVSNP